SRDLLANLRAAHLELLNRTLVGYEYDGVMRSISVSVDRLTDDGRRCLKDLAVLPDGTTTPVSVVKRLWGAGGLPVDRAAPILAELDALQLVRIHDQAITLHDLQRLYLLATSGDVSQVHARLLDAVGPPSEWDEVALEPYFYEHLSHHLVGAKRHA